jgi:hypothetical protein
MIPKRNIRLNGNGNFDGSNCSVFTNPVEVVSIVFHMESGLTWMDMVVWVFRPAFVHFLRTSALVTKSACVPARHGTVPLTSMKPSRTVLSLFD